MFCRPLLPRSAAYPDVLRVAEAGTNADKGTISLKKLRTSIIGSKRIAYFCSSSVSAAFLSSRTAHMTVDTPPPRFPDP